LFMDEVIFMTTFFHSSSMVSTIKLPYSLYKSAI
jgi:hypothetical protein